MNNVRHFSEFNILEIIIIIMGMLFEKYPPLKKNYQRQFR